MGGGGIACRRDRRRSTSSPATASSTATERRGATRYLKLTPDRRVSDFFTPFNQDALEPGEPRPRLRRRAAAAGPARRPPAPDGQRGQGRDDLPRRPRQHGPLQRRRRTTSSRRCRTSSRTARRSRATSARRSTSTATSSSARWPTTSRRSSSRTACSRRRRRSARRRSTPIRGAVDGHLGQRELQRDPLGRAANRPRRPRACSTPTTRRTPPTAS